MAPHSRNFMVHIGRFLIMSYWIMTSESQSNPSPLPTTKPPTNPGRLCCGDYVNDYYHNIDVWMRFDLDQFATQITYTTCDSDFDTYIQVWDKDRQNILASADNGCDVDTNRALLTQTNVPSDSYYIKFSHSPSSPDIETPNNRFVLGIICETNPPTLIPAIIPTLPPTKPCELEIKCFETISGQYNNEPMEYEFNNYGDETGVLYKNIQVNTCGSNFDTRLTILDDTLSEVIHGCNTLSQYCFCDNCGDDCQECVICEADNAQLVYTDIPAGKYYIIIDSPSEGIITGEYNLDLFCSDPVTDVPIPTPPPTMTGRMFCHESIQGTFNNIDVNIPFTLGAEYGNNAEVIIDLCESDFDTLLQVWDKDLQILYYENDNICGLQSSLEIEDLLPNDYYIVISSGANSEETLGVFVINIECIGTSVSTPPPSPQQHIINCGETMTGHYYGKKLEFLFDLIDESVTATFQTCESSFDTFVELKNGDLTQTYKACDDCGSYSNPLDCSADIGYVCCNGANPTQSALSRVLTPNRYYWTLDCTDINALYHQLPATFTVVLECYPSPPIHNIVTAPAQRPTQRPFSVWRTPKQCNDRCDAYSVSVQKYYYSNENICIRYNVQRLISNGYYCYRPIRYIILSLCDGDSIEDNPNGCSVDDLNGLLESFRVISNDAIMDSGSGSSSSDRRRLLSYSTSCFGTHSDGVYGVMVNVEIEKEMTFEICLRNVFGNNNIKFANQCRFRRGYNKYTCDNDWVIGLPCIDKHRFIGGVDAYGDSGFNTKGNKYGNYYQKPKRYRGSNSGSYDSAEDYGISLIDNTKLTAQMPIVRWEVLSCIVLFSLCLIGICIYCLILRKRKKSLLNNEKEIIIRRVDTIDDETDENDNIGIRSDVCSLESSDVTKVSQIFTRTKYKNIVNDTNDEIAIDESTSHF